MFMDHPSWPGYCRAGRRNPLRRVLVPERGALPRTAGGAPPGCWRPRWLRSCAGHLRVGSAAGLFPARAGPRPVCPALQM